MCVCVSERWGKRKRGSSSHMHISNPLAKMPANKPLFTDMKQHKRPSEDIGDAPLYSPAQDKPGCSASVSAPRFTWGAFILVSAQRRRKTETENRLQQQQQLSGMWKTSQTTAAGQNNCASFTETQGSQMRGKHKCMLVTPYLCSANLQLSWHARCSVFRCERLLKSRQKAFVKGRHFQIVLGGQMNLSSHSKRANQIFYFFFYCQLSRVVTAQGFLLVRESTLDSRHHPVASCRAPWCLTNRKWRDDVFSTEQSLRRRSLFDFYCENAAWFR